MKKKNALLLLDTILGLLTGVLAVCILYVLIWGFKQIFTLKPLIDIGKNLFLITMAPIIEETVKFIPLRFYFKSHYLLMGLMVGLGFGLVEYVLFVSDAPYDYLIYLIRFPALVIHTFTGGLMGYFISKKKSLLGLILAIVVHAIENTLMRFVF